MTTHATHATHADRGEKAAKEPPGPIMPEGTPESSDPEAKPSWLELYRQALSNEEWSDKVREWGHRSPANKHALFRMKDFAGHPSTHTTLFKLIEVVLEDLS